MIEIKYPPPAEKIILCGLRTPRMDKSLFEEDMQEMVMLCRTAGAKILETIIQQAPKPNAATYVGKGKLDQIHDAMVKHGCKTLIMDAELSPAQIRNIEKVIEGKVIDRSQLILDIFAQHARTNEARIQVELAQLRTLYPRLTHAWSHFSQQVGGIGTLGPGEKQLEVDRRLVQKKIDDLNDRLRKIEQSRQTQRKMRKDFINIALVGYTNVGKSSLLNALCGCDVLVENKLFATLDTASRRAYIPELGTVVISDTVGFLRKLPHHLVASFRSTLEVVHEADVLLIIMDASSAWSEYQLKTVHEVLSELDAEGKNTLLIFNKIDLVGNQFDRKRIEIAYPGSLLLSAFNPDDIQQLKQHIRAIVGQVTRDRKIEELIEKENKKIPKLPHELQ